MILKKKKNYFEEELAKNRNNAKELWKALKSLGVSLDKARKSNIYIKKDGTIQYKALENENTFRRFYSEVAGDLLKKLPKGTQQIYKPNNQEPLRQDFMQSIQ